MKVWIYIIFVLLLCNKTGAQKTSLYVSVSGNDNNSGSLAKPFKTLTKAILEAEKMKGKNMLVQLRGGTYYLDSTIMINSNDLETNTLEIAAYKDEHVHISAGNHLILKWQPYKNGIYKAKVPGGPVFERLYVDGALQVLARYPNYDSAARVFHGTAADAISPGRVKHWKNPVGGYVHAIHAYEWGGFHYRITGVDADGKLTLQGGWQNNRPNKMHNKYLFVENIFEELDAPGEWWLDRVNHLLYYYPAKNVNLETALIEVSHLKNSIELRGTAANPVRNITFRHLHFIHNERSFMETKEPLLRSDWTIYRGAAVLFDGTENCKISGCNFTGIGGNAIMLSNYNKQDTISGCEIAYIGANAVCFIGDTRAVRATYSNYNDNISYDQLDKTPGPGTNNYPQSCVVNDNLMHNLGEIEKQATGVEIEAAASITVSHNSIYNTPRAGLNIGDGAFGGHILEFNDVFNTVLETGDHGSFNSWGRDRYWSPDRHYMDSLVALHPELIFLDAQQTTTIRNNRFRCDHGWDIDLDDGSSNYHIYNNLCLNGGLKLREGFNRVVENNIMVNNSFHPHVWFKNSGDVFIHNIVMREYFPIQINYWGKQIDENLFPDSAALLTAQQQGTDKNSIAADPLFINAAAGDFRVQENSPARKIGFKNFPMEFGVQSASLKKRAATPVIPEIKKAGAEKKAATTEWFGATIKNVETLGERSAAGLPDNSGVLVLNVSSGNAAGKSGLHAGDVIRKAGDKNIKTVSQLQQLTGASQWLSEITLIVMRNQKEMEIVLHLK
ncbi:MAG: PDZ domain-containing protein [Bacteroidetes bacterium]|nr:PDZ domain-containing protein [Bacteroidota bacterium]